MTARRVCNAPGALYTEEWLLDHTDGFRLPTWWVKELAGPNNVSATGHNRIPV